MLSRRGLIGLAYSGTTTYEGSAEVPDTGPVTGEAVEIDLRNVKSLAEVIVNGHSAGIAWKAPCLLNVTHRLNPGANELSIRATNLWPNRLIGDQQPGAAPVAFATFTPYRPDVSLLESGLLGPVTTLRRTTEIAR
jgi:hypothetical protein